MELDVLGVDERFRAEEANVLDGDKREGFLRGERDLDPCGQHFAHEVGREAVHEGHGAENGVAHPFRAVTRGFLEGLLDAVFAPEVGDGSGVGVGYRVAAAVDAAVDEVLDVVGEGGMDHGFALGFFRLRGLAGAHGDLHREDAPYGGAVG